MPSAEEKAKKAKELIAEMEQARSPQHKASIELKFNQHLKNSPELSKEQKNELKQDFADKVTPGVPSNKPAMRPVPGGTKY